MTASSKTERHKVVVVFVKVLGSFLRYFEAWLHLFIYFNEGFTLRFIPCFCLCHLV